MSATVHDLVSARAERGKKPLHFDTDLDALAFITSELNDLRRQVAGELLIPVGPLELQLAQISAVVAAVGDLYRRDERGMS